MLGAFDLKPHVLSGFRSKAPDTIATKLILVVPGLVGVGHGIRRG